MADRQVDCLVNAPKGQGETVRAALMLPGERVNSWRVEVFLDLGFQEPL